MAGKRKRTRSGRDSSGDDKRQRTQGGFNSKDPVIKHAVLAQYYPKVLSLREFLLSKLPTSSKIRKKKIWLVGRKEPSHGKEEHGLASFLDRTLVGVLKCKEISQEQRDQDWTTFSQRIDTSDSNLENTSSMGRFSQLEIVDFAIWLLFSKSRRPQHLLCEGFRKDLGSNTVRQDANAASAIPGVMSTYPNSHVTDMKASPWPLVLALMGKEGERSMIDLILDCGIFLPVASGHGSFHQLSGQPLGDLKCLPKIATVTSSLQKPNLDHKSVPRVAQASETLRTPANITFVRTRMLYARATLNASGGVRSGLRRTHALNRFPHHFLPENPSDTEQKPHQHTLQVMMYIFPRQFDLHNVFTSNVDTRETAQPFQDYTIREEDIQKKYSSPSAVKIPRRLRGLVVQLVQKLQVQHIRCSYKQLLQYYCPLPSEKPRSPEQVNQFTETTSTASATFKTQQTMDVSYATELIVAPKPEIPSRKPSVMNHATPVTMVSSFCRSILANIIPHEFWGHGDVRAHNERIFHRNVDRFIELRRFESLSLHEVSQGMKVADIEWLSPPGFHGQKLSQSDFHKRSEIFHEFLYYVFDSILIPLIRASFYVTESNVHKSRLFFIRHDVWKSLAEPAIASVKLSMFEEVKTAAGQNRALGFSQVRLLPKETGVRPIMNLRRRQPKKGYRNVLGPSINSLLAPVFNAINFEKNLNPGRLGSTMLSVGDLYQKLKTFKSNLQDSTQPLYFAKVDVKAAFDTIPQDAVLKLMASLPTESGYRMSRHVAIKPGEGYRHDERSKPIRKWTSKATASDDSQSFNDDLENNLAVGRKNTIFIETIVNQLHDTSDLMSLLSEHVKRNMVKIGKKFYRQKQGIPQGSVLSSLLCNYFYADLEANHLQFLQAGNSLLMRLIDDFLLITTERPHARQFLQVMHDGLPAYGVQVNPDKTLVNFEVMINGKKIARVVGTRQFPYCGSFIDTRSLNLTKDRDRGRDLVIADSLTVEYSRVPGKTFHRKVLNSFKLQCHPMYFDTLHNSKNTVLSNVYNAFIETATKMWSYSRCLGRKQPRAVLVIKVIRDLIDLVYALLKKQPGKRSIGLYACIIHKTEVTRLAITAFQHVLGKRQSKYRDVLVWLKCMSKG